MSVVPYSEWFTIYAFQEGQNGTATVQSLNEYMQEAAGNHAASLGVSIDRLGDEGLAWVLARMRVVPALLPVVHERIQVETWPVGVEGLQFRRDFILRREDGSELARAVSHWVIVSLATRKIVRIPAFVAEIALDNATTAMEDVRQRLPEVDEVFEAISFRARLSDVDRNRHVNNVRYMEWVMESVPEDIRSRMHLEDLDLTFRAESYWNDVAVVRTMPVGGDEGVFFHSLVRQGDGKELVRARSVWRA